MREEDKVGDENDGDVDVGIQIPGSLACAGYKRGA